MLSGPNVSPPATRRNCSKKGTIAAGFSIGMPAVRSSMPETVSLALARAIGLTGGALGILLFELFFVFVALGVWRAAAGNFRKWVTLARTSKTKAERNRAMGLFWSSRILRRLRKSLLHTADLELVVPVK